MIAGRVVRLRSRRARLAGAVLALVWAAPGLARSEPHSVELVADQDILGTALRDLDGDGLLDVVVATLRPLGTDTSERRLAFYRATRQDGRLDYALERELSVPDDVIAWGLGDFAGTGSPQVLYFTASSVFRFDVESGQATRILADPGFFFTMPSDESLPYWGPITDLDGDGREDLILAGRNGYAIYRQTSAHALEPAGRVAAGFDYVRAPSTQRRRRWAGRRRLWTGRSLNRLCLADTNADSRVDLIAMKGHDVLAYAQREDGGFDDEPSLTHSLIAPGGVPFGDADWQALPKIAHGDVNADGRVDFIVPEIELGELSTRLRIFVTSDAGLPDTPTQILKLSSLGDTPELYDINGDGFLDLGVATVRTDLLLTLANPSVTSIDFTYYAFLFHPDEGTFSRRPDLKWDASYAIPQDELDVDEEDGDGSQVFMRIDGDFNADGAGDLAVLDFGGALRIHTSRIVGVDSMEVKLVSTPLFQAEVGRPEDVRTVDLDGDGRSDFALRYADSVVLLVNAP